MLRNSLFKTIRPMVWQSIGCFSSKNKSIPSKEHDFAREFMRNRDEFMYWEPGIGHRKMLQIFTEKTPISSLNSHQQLLNEFGKRLKLARLASDINASERIRFDDILAKLCHVVPALNDAQLMQAMMNLASMGKIERVSQPYKQLQSIIDAECSIRCTAWDVDALLGCCLVRCCTNEWYKSSFNQCAREQLVQRAGVMTPQQLVLALFYLKKATNVNFHAFEKDLQRICDELSLEELSIAAITLYRANTRLKRTTLIRKIYEKMLNSTNMGEMDSVAFTALIKVSCDSAI